MKLRKLFYGAAALAMVSVAATSCTNEMVSPYPDRNPAGNSSSMLVHAPDLYAWSGTQSLSGTRSGFGTRAESLSGISFVEVRTTDLDKKREEEIIEDYLPEQNENLKDEIQRNFIFKAPEDITFELYPIYCQTNTPKTVGIFYWDANGNYGEVENVFNGITQWEGRCTSEWKWEEGKGNYEVTTFFGKKVSIPAGYIFGFFWNGNNNNGVTTYYSIDQWNDDCFATNGGGQKLEPERFSKLHGVTFELEGKTYMGLEDWTDFDFQDLVFTCPENLVEVPTDQVPEKGQNWTDDTFPGGTDTPTPPTPPTGGDDEDDDCEICGHPSHDGICDECKPGESDCHPECPKCHHTSHGDGPCRECGDNTGCNHKDEPAGPGNNPNTPDTPETLDPAHHNDEVEVNFSINDVHTDANRQKYEAADLWTKLSIHVRKGTDVKIHVPLPGRYLCESDDFAILQDHANGIYTGQEGVKEGVIDENHYMTYRIQKDETTYWDVTLYVNITEDGMDVWTDGITQELIDYLFEKNGDGINFEIWNYYQTETVKWIDGEKQVTPTLTAEQYAAFQGYLDQSTIEFLDDAPSFYINAFGFDWTNGVFSQDIRPRDCLVTPTDKSKFEMNPMFCYHLNGTPWNIIWTNTKVDRTSDDYKHHSRTADPAVSVDKY